MDEAVGVLLYTMNFSTTAFALVAEDFHQDTDVAPNPYTAQEDWSAAAIVLLIVAALPILAHRSKHRRHKDKAKREEKDQLPQKLV
jgi:hypothetical protein